MKKILTAVSLALFLSVSPLLGESNLYAAQQVRPEFVPDEILVKFREGSAPAALDNALKQVNGRLLKKFRMLPLLHHFKVPPDTVKAAVSMLKTLPEVEYAELNYLRYPDVVPSDARFSELWAMNNTGQTGGTIDADMDAAEAWDITTGNPNQAVAVIDSGVDMAHPDLASNIYTNPGEIAGNGIDDDANGFIDDVNGWDFSHNDNNPADSDAVCGGHGTHVSGTIGAKGNDGIGVAGVNWDVKIMPLKIFRTYYFVLCSASSSDIIAAIDYAAMMGVRVSNNSYGSSNFSQAESDAIKASKSVYVVAAGNEGVNNDATPSYPANYNLPNIISVAAVDHNDAKPSWSNYGVLTVDLAAPGASILSTTPNNTYSLFDGTSMATPHVAGSVALLMGYDTLLTNNEVKWRILKGTDYKALPVATGGRLNINNTLLLPPPLVSVNVTPIGPTTVVRGGSISYNVAVNNTQAAVASVNASIVAVLPDGTEYPLLTRTISVPGNSTLSQDFTRVIPLTAPVGDYQISGRAEMTSASYDESILAFTVAP